MMLLFLSSLCMCSSLLSHKTRRLGLSQGEAQEKRRGSCRDNIRDELQKVGAKKYTKILKHCRTSGILFKQKVCELRCSMGYTVEEVGQAACKYDGEITIQFPKCRDINRPKYHKCPRSRYVFFKKKILGEVLTVVTYIAGLSSVPFLFLGFLSSCINLTGPRSDSRFSMLMKLIGKSTSGAANLAGFITFLLLTIHHAPTTESTTSDDCKAESTWESTPPGWRIWEHATRKSVKPKVDSWVRQHHLYFWGTSSMLMSLISVVLLPLGHYTYTFFPPQQHHHRKAPLSSGIDVSTQISVVSALAEIGAVSMSLVANAASMWCFGIMIIASSEEDPYYPGNNNNDHRHDNNDHRNDNNDHRHDNDDQEPKYANAHDDHRHATLDDKLRRATYAFPQEQLLLDDKHIDDHYFASNTLTSLYVRPFVDFFPYVQALLELSWRELSILGPEQRTDLYTNVFRSGKYLHNWFTSQNSAHNQGGTEAHHHHHHPRANAWVHTLVTAFLVTKNLPHRVLSIVLPHASLLMRHFRTHFPVESESVGEDEERVEVQTTPVFATGSIAPHVDELLAILDECLKLLCRVVSKTSRFLTTQRMRTMLDHVAQGTVLKFLRRFSHDVEDIVTISLNALSMGVSIEGVPHSIELLLPALAKLLREAPDLTRDVLQPFLQRLMSRWKEGQDEEDEGRKESTRKRKKGQKDSEDDENHPYRASRARVGDGGDY